MLLRHQSQLLIILDMVGLRLSEAKSKLEPAQDIQFLGLFGSRDSFPPSIQGSGDNGTDNLIILPENIVVYRIVPIHGITQLGLRSHPAGSSTLEALAFSFIRSDKQVFTNMSFRPFSPCHPTQALAGPIVSHIRNPYPTFPGGVPRAVAHTWRILELRVFGPSLERQLHINVLELTSVILALHHWAAVLQGQTTLLL